MFDVYPTPQDAVLMATAIIHLARQIEPAFWLYLAAAAIARFRHRHMWIAYVGFAVAALLVGHH